MIIASWNINGLRSYQKKYNLKDFLEKYKIDILNLQETKLIDGWDAHQELELKNNWYIDQNIASIRKGYSGVATISKGKVKQLPILFENRRFQEEGRILMFKYHEYYMINIYFPQGDRSKKDIPYKLEVLEYIIKWVQSIHGKWIICGDFNMATEEIDLARPKYNKNNNMFTFEEREKMHQLKAVGAIDVYRYMYPEKQNFTWWPYAYNARERDVGWRIDYIFVSENLKAKIKRVEILKEVLGSDHCPILVEIEEGD